CLVRVVFDPAFAQRVARARAALPAAPEPLPSLKAQASSAGPALRLLAQLQREGRFVDFCEEEIASFTDAEVGAAARTVHAGCRKALRANLVLKPVRPDAEGAEVTAPEGFDPTSVRLTGNVVGHPPFRGTLRHHGWKADS